jgi:hypothetical protein
MTTINFTNGKKETKNYKEVSNTNQGVYGKDEIIRTVSTDNVNELTNEQYNTRFEEIK